MTPLSLLLLGACGGPVDPITGFDVNRPLETLPAVEDLEPGLTLLSEEDGLWLAWREDDLAVYAQVRPGADRPAEFTDADLGPYEIDSRVLDVDGYPFIETWGGHGPYDARWNAAVELPEDAVDSSHRDRDHAMAADLAQAWAEHPLAVDYPFMTDDLLVVTVGDLEMALLDLEAQPLENLRGGTFEHRTWVTYASCCVTWGEHSAVVVKTINKKKQLVLTRQAGNHGRKGTDPSMTQGDYRAWGGRSNKEPTLRNKAWRDADTFASSKGGGCNTSYGTVPGTHVCNDDSQAEWKNVRDNAIDYTQSTCSDWSLKTKHPTFSSGLVY